MKSRIGGFNIYLAALGCMLFLGCETMGGKGKKDLATLDLHREVNPDGTGKSELVPIRREEPRIYLNVEKEAFLYEADILRAEVVEMPGGFAIRLQFDHRGTKRLEAFSVYNQGKHFAINCHFPEARWLAAPLFSRRIQDGSITFTPDATREEADRIVRGLNNVARKVHKRSF